MTTTTRTQPPLDVRPTPWLVPLIVGMGALVTLYAPLAPCFARLPMVGTDNEGLGVLAPLIAIVLAWQKRSELRALPASPHVAGWSLLSCGLILALLGHRLGIRLPLALSLPLVVGGALWTLRGPAVVAALWFPLLLLAAITPFPSELSKAVSFPLQTLAARFSALALGLTGMSVERAGLTLVANGQTVQVSEGCSGWRSFTAAFWLFLILAHQRPPRSWWQWAGLLPLLLVAALLANILRVALVVALAAHGQPWALQSPWHEILGLACFAPMVWLLVETALGRPPEGHPETAGEALPVVVLPAAGVTRRQVWRVAGAAWIACGLAVLGARAVRLGPVPAPPEPPPPSAGAWKRTDFTGPGRASAGEWVSQASYGRPGGKMAAVAWQIPFATDARPFRAVNVWLKRGYELMDARTVVLAGPRRRVPVLLALVARGPDRRFVAVTHLNRHRALSSDTGARIRRIAEQIFHGSASPWLTVAVVAADPEDALDLQRRLLPLSEQWLVGAGMPQ